jgi:hypothetical protein
MQKYCELEWTLIEVQYVLLKNEDKLYLWF